MNEIRKKVNEYFPELLQNLRELVSYPSVYSDDAPPFGQANIDCLNHALSLGDKLGFKAVNLDNYAGYIEIGSGDEVIGIVGHLDVVPVSDTWKTDPFTLYQDVDKAYGRGTSDDKGGVLCGLMAMKILSEIKPDLNKRIRLIMGCNEESGSAGLRYYIEKEGYVDCGFTPDGSFPVVFGEKGMIRGAFEGTTEKILSINGGTAANAVPAKVTFKVPAGSFNEEKFTSFLTENNLTCSIDRNENWTVTVNGKAAHASTPEEGINAISYAMEALYVSDFNDPFVDGYHEYVGTGYYGEKQGVDVHDEYGRLTSNLGVITLKDGVITVTVDIRFPVTMTNQPLVEKLIASSGGHITKAGGADPLFFPLDHPMIKALLKAYYDVTNSDLKPLTMGGGTYARTMHNIVAFGCDTQDYNWHIHDNNEFVTFKSLKTQTEIYTPALLNLLEL
ncbi:MAG: Sapep family Mn(2+)-dependent dipeptidase [Erysipelotrichaceae bacterium]|nr:Sapep family Mn(2+)-dependent dipeptidase [Erysipelotrichaceae bacterium]